MQNLKTYFLDFIYLFFPDSCLSCDNIMVHSEKTICTRCLINLPKTRDWNDQDHFLLHRFGSIYPCHFASSFLFLSKGSSVEKMIYQFKYKGRKDMAELLGFLYGQELQTSSRFIAQEFDLIIPIPLHKSRKRQRGYNQSVEIAKGLSRALNIPYDDSSCIRSKKTETQTLKGKINRIKNVEGVFQVVETEKIENKNILIIDDVITTGSTVDALCAAVVKTVKTIGILSLAKK